MKALVLCAGFGRRLGQLCADRPKPLLSLGSHTIAEHILAQLREAGVTEVFVNLHHFAEQFEPQLGNGSRFGLRIHYVPEPKLLGTAGSAANIRDRMGGQPLLVHYGDVVMNHPLDRLRSLHERSDAEATILMHRRAGSNSRVWCDETGLITRFVERPSTPHLGADQPWVFSGVCLLSPHALEELPERAPLDLPADVFGRLVAKKALFGQPLCGYRWAVDSPERLARARAGLAGRSTQTSNPNPPSSL